MTEKIIPIGKIKILWFDEYLSEEKIENVFFEFYIPKSISKTNLYYSRFIFMKDDLAIKTETCYTDKFTYKQISYDEKSKLFKIEFLGNIIFLDNAQYKLLQLELGKLNVDIN